MEQNALSYMGKVNEWEIQLSVKLNDLDWIRNGCLHAMNALHHLTKISLTVGIQLSSSADYEL